jgi:hypothetical protein
MSDFVHPAVASFERGPFSLEQAGEEHLKLLSAAEGMIDHPPARSQEIKALGVAKVERLKNPDKYPVFKSVTDFLNHDRQDLPPDQRIHLLRIGLQYILMRPGVAEDYEKNPEKGRDPAQWHHWMDLIFSDDGLTSDLTDALGNFNNQANIPKRSAGIRIANAAHARDLPEDISWVDCGTSAGLGIVPIAYNLPFSRITVKGASRYESALISKALKHRVDVKNCFGFDLAPPPNKYWIEACSYYPSELTNERLREERENLYDAAKKIPLLWGNITLPSTGLDDVRDRLKPDGKADAVSGITSLYEVNNEDRETARVAFEGLGRYLAIVQDVAEIDPDDSRKLIYSEDIYAEDAHYNLFAKLLAIPDAPYIKLGRWLTFRCNTFIPSKALIAMLERAQR